MNKQIYAGAAQGDITPVDSQFLYGYPHVERYSTGTHDKLWSSALYLSDGKAETLFIANDIIYVGKASAAAIRARIARATGLSAGNIMITATHTHSGPKTVDNLCSRNDPAVPKADVNYVRFMEDRIVETALKAYQNKQPAKIGLAFADSTGVGTNRRNPVGPSDHEVPVLVVKSLSDLAATKDDYIACMLVCSMHPTVLHEDSTLISGDFPGLSRIYLQENLLGKSCPVLHHTGPAGNQSPRHVTKANTFAEAERLGVILGKAVEQAVAQIEYRTEATITVLSKLLHDVPKREFPSVAQSQKKLDQALNKLKLLKAKQASKQEIRTAECDWFGAEETLTLSQAAESGLLEQAYEMCLPAEIQIIKIGQWSFIGWQGEIFIEYALKLKEQLPNSFVISLANGALQGYIVTKEAHEEGGYEASNAIFDYRTGEMFLQTTLDLLK